MIEWVSAMSENSEAGHSPSGVLERTLAVLEMLANHAHGLPLFEIADRLEIPRSATHRILSSLVEHGYVRQERNQGVYLLTAKIASLAFTFLAGSGITDLAQPILDRLARETGELVRLAVVDDNSLTWVAKAQGSQYGLRYDADSGRQARLSCSASGLAWLSGMSDEAALALVQKQGFGNRVEYGPRAPQTPAAFLKSLRLTRKRGYSITVQTFTPWMSAMAAPVRHPGTGEITGTVSVAGPHVRLTEKRMHEIAPLVLMAAAELSQVSLASPALSRRRGGSEPTIFADQTQ